MKSDGSGSTPKRRIQSGDVVGYRYIIRSDSGQVLAVSADVIHYLHGSGQGAGPQVLASRMEGRRGGERFTTVLSASEAFGSGDHRRRLTLPRDRFPDLMQLSPGTRVVTETPEGDSVSLWVIDATESEVRLDFDHPLAGRTLHFEVSVISIRTATPDERSSGRPEPHAERASSDVHGQLLDLRALLELQFSDEDRNGGLLGDRITKQPGNQGRIDALRSARHELLSKLDAIVQRLDDQRRYDHRPALALLLEEFERHRAAGAELLQDALLSDVGGEG